MSLRWFDRGYCPGIYHCNMCFSDDVKILYRLHFETKLKVVSMTHFIRSQR